MRGTREECAPDLKHPDLPKTRIAGVDALKTFAIFAVVCIHALQPDEFGSASQAWVIWLRICRFAVPCFFLIAGYFFMRTWTRVEESGKTIGPYFKRLFIVFVFWGVFYTVVPPFIGGTSRPSDGPILPAIEERLLQTAFHPKFFILSGNAYHLWFLSSLIQAAAVVSICLRFSSIRAALVLGSIFYGIALAGGAYVNSPFGLHCHFDMKSGPLVSTIYFAIGAWFKQHEHLVTPRLGAILLAAGAGLQPIEELYDQQVVNSGYLVGTLPYAAGVFLLSLTFPLSPGNRIATLGAYSLGIYVLHAYVIEILLRLPIDAIKHCPPVFAVIVFALSSAVVIPLLKLPLLRTILA